MPVIVISGPEKAGKTTLIIALKSALEQAGTPVRTRHWSHLGDEYTSDLAYGTALAEDSAFNGIVVWDRSWACSHVYGKLLDRKNRSAEDPWMLEWLYGRAVPLRYMLLGPHWEVMLADRTADDLPVHPRDEQRAFLDYAATFGWRTLPARDSLDRYPVAVLAKAILDDAVRLGASWDPVAYCGQPGARVVFVGDRRSARDTIPGGWLPFTSRYTTHYGRILGPAAVRVGWTNALDTPTPIFDHARLVVACGGTAYAWAKGELEQRAESQVTKLLRVPHPSALYRWGAFSAHIPRVEADIRASVHPHTPLAGVPRPETLASATPSRSPHGGDRSQPE